MPDHPIPPLYVDPPQAWRKAKCRGIIPSQGYDPFFDEDDPGPAVDFCNGTDDGILCPVRDECLIFALANDCRDGVWGGTEPITRKAIRKRWPTRIRNRGQPVRPEWKWMDRDSALAGMDEEKLRREMAEGTG